MGRHTDRAGLVTVTATVGVALAVALMELAGCAARDTQTVVATKVLPSPVV